MANPQNSIALFAARNIDGLATGTTALVVPDAVEAYRPLWLTIVLQTAVALVTPPSISLGVGGPNYEDDLPLTALPAALAAQKALTYFLSSGVGPATGVTAASGTAVNLNVRVAANANTYLFDAIVSGYFDI